MTPSLLNFKFESIATCFAEAPAATATVAVSPLPIDSERLCAVVLFAGTEEVPPAERASDPLLPVSTRYSPPTWLTFNPMPL